MSGKLKLTKNQLRRLGESAWIRLSDKEEKRVRGQLLAILEMVAVLRRLRTGKIPPLSQVVSLKNVVREDRARPSLSSQEALLGATGKHQGFFKTKPVFEQDDEGTF